MDHLTHQNAVSAVATWVGDAGRLVLTGGAGVAFSALTGEPIPSGTDAHTVVETWVGVTRSEVLTVLALVQQCALA